ncbi:MAG TPA: hypothetical protein VG188_01160 [Solirubrobacteraceae bacterium]|nr:hypothetical protein [Solirubrobacteraceae bacterium]
MSFYHLELRQFPHLARRFNQSEQQVLALAKPWVAQEWIEEAERKWNINEATLTILEGPKLSMADLAMGRGWRNAQRRSDDVTERVLAGFREDGGGGAGSEPGRGRRPGSGAAEPGLAASGGSGETPGGSELALLADSLGLELLALLEDGPVAPVRVWQLAQERVEGRPLAEALALADGAVRSLLARRLVVLHGREAGEGGAGDALSAEHVETALGSIDAWTAGGQTSVAIVRKG